MRDAADICDQKQDAYAAMSEGPEDIPTCPMCGKQGHMWRHPDLECQTFFDELASEWRLAEGQEVNTEACSNACWKEFVFLSQGEAFPRYQNLWPARARTATTLLCGRLRLGTISSARR